MTWDEMSPRERDALVAEHIMGAVWTHEPKWPGGPADYLKLPDGAGGVLAERRCSDGRTVYPAGLRHYTTDIAAACEVVEEMQGQWWWFSVETFPSPYGMNDGNEVMATFKPTGMPGQANDDVRASAETAPLAICLAALRARGVDV